MSVSTCNCDGTITDISLLGKLFGTGRDDLLAGIDTLSLAGGFDPRPGACQQAVGILQAQGQDPCNLDSPDDLQVYYREFIKSQVGTGAGTPVSNSIQKTADILFGTATADTPVVPPNPPKPATTNLTFIIGAIAILAIGFFLVFR